MYFFLLSLSTTFPRQVGLRDEALCQMVTDRFRPSAGLAEKAQKMLL